MKNFLGKNDFPCKLISQNYNDDKAKTKMATLLQAEEKWIIVMTQAHQHGKVVKAQLSFQ